MAELTLEALQQQFNDLKKRVNILEGIQKEKLALSLKQAISSNLQG